MQRKKRIGCWIVFLVALWFTYGFGSPVHWSDDIHGRIIDEETGKPIEGAVVMAAWVLESYVGNDEAFCIYRAEAATDRNGEYVVDGLPLRIRPPFVKFERLDPRMYVYKPGFVGDYLTNSNLGRYGYQGPFDTRSPKRRCYWNGQTIPLERARTPKVEAEVLGSVESFIWTDGFIPPRRFPRIWNAAAAGYRHLPADVQQVTGNPQEVIDNYDNEDSR